MEELEKGMALLEKMRSVIGEKSYAEKVQSVFAAFPVFATFDACVEVIDVDAVPPPNHELGDDNGSIFCTPLPPAPGVPSGTIVIATPSLLIIRKSKEGP